MKVLRGGMTKIDDCSRVAVASVIVGSEDDDSGCGTSDGIMLVLVGANILLVTCALVCTCTCACTCAAVAATATATGANMTLINGLDEAVASIDADDEGATVAPIVAASAAFVVAFGLVATIGGEGTATGTDTDTDTDAAADVRAAAAAGDGAADANADMSGFVVAIDDIVSFRSVMTACCGIASRKP